MRSPCKLKIPNVYLYLFYKIYVYILLCWKKSLLHVWSFQAINLWIHFHFQRPHHQQRQKQQQQQQQKQWQQRFTKKMSQRNTIIYLQLQQVHLHNRPPQPPGTSQWILLHFGWYLTRSKFYVIKLLCYISLNCFVKCCKILLLLLGKHVVSITLMYHKNYL